MTDTEESQFSERMRRHEDGSPDFDAEKEDIQKELKRRGLRK